MEARQELEMRGIGAAPGIVAGPVLLLKADDEPLPEYAVDAADVPREMLRLEAALIETRRQLHDVQRRVGEALGGESAGIFEAHLQVVDDPSFVDEVYRDLRERRRNVEKAVFDVAERYARTLREMEDDYLRERAADIRDVARRILRNLAGGGEWLAGLETPRVLVAHDVAPSEMAAFDRRKVLGVVTEGGSPTSHVAIMARAMDLPAIVGVRGATARLADGDRVVLDGVRGLLVAADLHEDRLARLRENLARVGHPEVRVRRLDAATARLDAFREVLGGYGGFDAVLLDAPCTNTGVIRRRPDARWNFSRGRLAKLRAQQERLLDNAARWVVPGGRLLYSTCSLEPEEDEELALSWIARHPNWSAGRARKLFPPDTQTDGAYIALFRRSSPLASAVKETRT